MKALIAVFIMMFSHYCHASDVRWNDDGINWYSYEEGLKEAKASNKPIFSVFYTNWCPHSHAYSALFYDRSVVQQSKNFVMVKIDRDQQPDVNLKYGAHGIYIPRTVFLDSDGGAKYQINSGRQEYPHFIDYASPDELLQLMQDSLR